MSTTMAEPGESYAREIERAGKSAMHRNSPSAPLRWLWGEGYIHNQTSVLDFGCGRGADGEFLRSEDIYVREFDPVHRPDWKILRQRFDVVTCTYVFNVLPESMEKELLGTLRVLLNPGGKAYITVRRDVGAGKQSNGRLQRNVVLDLPVLISTHRWCIYTLEAS